MSVKVTLYDSTVRMFTENDPALEVVIDPDPSKNSWYVEGHFAAQGTGSLKVLQAVGEANGQAVKNVTVTIGNDGNTIFWSFNYGSANDPQPFGCKCIISYSRSSNLETDLQALAPLQITERLSAELDSGTFSFMEIGDDEPKQFALYKITAQDEGTTDKADFPFYGIYQRALMSRTNSNDPLYKYTVQLTEPSKLLEGILIDGAGVSQPEDTAQRQSLYDVVTDLLVKATLDRQTVAKDAIVLTSDPKVTQVLKAIKSPEYQWNAQATLWECLEQLGQCADAIPRLLVTPATVDGEIVEQYVLTYEFVNDGDETFDMDSDFAKVSVTGVGESLNEDQFASALGSVVDNLREE